MKHFSFTLYPPPKKFLEDYKLFFKKDYSFIECRLRMIKHPHMKYIWYSRKLADSSSVAKYFYKFRIFLLSHRFGLEIDNFDRIGSGFVLYHPYNITVNPSASFGNHIALYKGVTVGSVRTGKREGIPSIGNNVVICSNAVVVGGITIGDNVLIAANAFVDFDVPSNSVVIGNPGKIIHKPDNNPCFDYL